MKLVQRWGAVLVMVEYVVGSRDVVIVVIKGLLVVWRWFR